MKKVSFQVHSETKSHCFWYFFFVFNKNFSYIKSIFLQLDIIPLEKLWLALIEQNTKTMKLDCASLEFSHSLPKGFSLYKIFPSFPLGYIQLQNKSCVKKVSVLSSKIWNQPRYIYSYKQRKGNSNQPALFFFMPKYKMRQGYCIYTCKIILGKLAELKKMPLTRVSLCKITADLYLLSWLNGDIHKSQCNKLNEN